MADPLRLGPWRHFPGVGWARTFTHCEVDGAQTTATQWRLWPPVEYTVPPLASGPETGLEGRQRADAAAPERHHLVQRLFGALSGGEADPEMYRQLQGALERAGLRAAAEQARDAHALARIAERRPASAPVAPAEHLQLFEGVA